ICKINYLSFIFLFSALIIQSFELFFFLWLSVWNGQFTDQ
ncbi:putative membrane protein, partial [Bacteroides fragilis str. S6L5]